VSVFKNSAIEWFSSLPGRRPSW